MTRAFPFAFFPAVFSLAASVFLTLTNEILLSLVVWLATLNAVSVIAYHEGYAQGSKRK